MNLIEYWPGYLRDIVEFQQIANSEQPEVTAAIEAVRNAPKEFYLSTLTEYGVERWEGILKITPAEGDSLDTRRERVAAALMYRLPYTWTTLLSYLSTVSDYNIATLDADAYTLALTIELSGYDERDALTAILRQMVPANLVVNLRTLIRTTHDATPAAAGAVSLQIVQHIHKPKEE